MTDREWMKEGIDVKLTLLLYRKKVWISLLWALAGGLLAGGLYFIVHVLYAPAREYEAVSKLYLTFAADDDGEAYQYYNGYTWNDLMKTEPILDKVMEGLPEGTDREWIKDTIAADILSDIRLLTITVRTHDGAEAGRIIRAAEDALVRFGQEMVEFEKIEVIEHGQAALVVVENETFRAVAAGLVVGFLLSLAALALGRVLDDSLYVPSDFEKRYPYPVLGAVFAGERMEEDSRLQEHVEMVSGETAGILYVDTGRQDVRIPPEGRAADMGLILQIPCGSGNGKLLERWVREAETCGCRILGAVFTEADKSLYRLYFIGKKR